MLVQCKLLEQNDMHHSTTKWVEIMLLYKGPDLTHGTANRQLDHLRAFAHVTHRADPQGPGRFSRNLLHLTGDHWTGRVFSGRNIHLSKGSETVEGC